jgi:hypothetical protein
MGVSVVAFIGLLLWMLESSRSSSRPQEQAPRPEEGEISESYRDSGATIRPGVTTENEFYSNLGQPNSTDVIERDKYLYYSSNQGYNDYAVIEDGLLSYAMEHEPSSGSEEIANYRKRYGTENLILPDRYEDSRWFVFLDNGIAVSVKGSLKKVFYFIPQSETQFKENFKEELGFAEDDPNLDPEVFMPAL